MCPAIRETPQVATLAKHGIFGIRTKAMMHKTDASTKAVLWVAIGGVLWEAVLLKYPFI